MLVITKTELEKDPEFYIDKIMNGCMFIYPTGTLYNIGCDATNEKAVSELRKIKQRPSLHFPVIVPNMDWITDNCQIEKENKEWLKRLPGPYTFLVRLKNKNAVTQSVCEDKLPIRYPNHWIKDFIENLGVPIVATSVNASNNVFMTDPEDIDMNIKKQVSFLIDEGIVKNSPLKLIDLTESKIKILDGFKK